MDEEIQDGVTSETETQKRFRRKSTRRQLQETLDEFDKLIKDPTVKSAKRADLLMSRVSVLQSMMASDADEKQSATAQENERLTAQHGQDAARITELESENMELRRRDRQQIVTVESPESAKLKEVNASYDALLTYLTSNIGDADARARLAIRVIQKFSESAARLFLPLMNCDYAHFKRLLNENKPEQELFAIIERSSNPNGDLVVFARAALAVVHGVPLSSPKTSKDQPRVDPRDIPELENRLEALTAQRERLIGQRERPVQEQVLRETTPSQTSEDWGS